eukprot:8684178-Alexandrium_andersonii.AAC.1
MSVVRQFSDFKHSMLQTQYGINKINVCRVPVLRIQAVDVTNTARNQQNQGLAGWLGLGQSATHP